MPPASARSGRRATRRGSCRSSAASAIRHFTTFAVYVDDDYVNDFGPAALDCVREYGQVLRLALTPRGHII